VKKTDEVKVHGRAAVKALFRARPEALIRVYLVDELADELRPILDHCRKNRLAFHVVDAEELERVSGSQHHEGVCVLAKAKKKTDIRSLAAIRGRATLLALDGITNPHNLGAILRTAAHFGTRAVIIGGSLELTPAAMRVAEGGAEHVDVVRVADLAKALRDLAEAGYEVVATTSHRAESLFAAQISDRAVLLLGHEGGGISDPVGFEATRAIRIPGTGKVESLNVAAAAAVLLAEMSRKGGERRGGDRRAGPRRAPRRQGRR
jgi:TrmH RNA methyltransferase